MFLVGLGADDRAERMVAFLAKNSDMDISLITFHGFAYDGRTLLAKGGARRRSSGLRVAPGQSIRERGGEASAAGKARGRIGRDRAVRRRERYVQRNLARIKHTPGSLWAQHQASETVICTNRCLEGEGGVSIVFFPRAKAPCLDAFKEPVAAIPHDTWPADRHPLEDADAEIQFRLTAGDWVTHEETLTRLARAVYEMHQASEAT